jgi:parallel beta-helix repeat protein
LLYDSELRIGGPGGGSTTQIYGLNATMGLGYQTGSSHHYVNDPTAWDVGTDTGETSQGVAEYYTTPGIVHLDAGPSFIEPLWNATPGGNEGVLTAHGTVSPDNAFIFLSQGATFDVTSAAWAPYLPGGSYSFEMSPGTYSGVAILADHDTQSLLYSGGGSVTQDIALAVNFGVGVDTPLFAWNNNELAALSFQGNGTIENPYLLDNNQYYPLSSLFGEMNDFLFPVFPGMLISGTTAYFNAIAPAPFTVEFPPGLSLVLIEDGMPTTDQLQIELYDTDHATISDGTIGGWMYGGLLAYPPNYPDGEIVLWGATNSLIARNVFQDQGVGIVLMQGTNNIIWGNEFLNGLLGSLTFPQQFGIWELESGDIIYNNAFDTTITAYSPSYNLFTGLPQINLDYWNLSNWVQTNSTVVVNGYALSGSLFGLPAVCGNWWYDYLPGDPLPYNEPFDGGTGLIETGGDFCPTGPNGTLGFGVTFTEEGLGSGSWSVTLAGITETAAVGQSLIFAMPNGTWDYSVAGKGGYTEDPASGTVTVSGANRTVAIAYAPNGVTVVSKYLATLSESGLAAGTNWTVHLGSSSYRTNASAISWLLGDGTYSYSVSGPSQYSISGTSGAFSVDGGNVTRYVTFSADPGWLNATVDPTNASVWIDGQPASLSDGGFSVELAAGLHAVEATAPDYAPFYDNVSVPAGLGTTLTIHLTLVTKAPGSSTHNTSGTSSTSSSSPAGLTSDQFYGLLFGLLAVAVAIVIAAFVIRGRRGDGGPEPAEPPSETYDYSPPPVPEEAPYYEGPPPGEADETGGYPPPG